MKYNHKTNYPEFSIEQLIALYKLYNNKNGTTEFEETFKNDKTTARQLIDTITTFTDEREYLQFLGKILPWDQPTHIEYAYIGRTSIRNSQWGRLPEKIRKMYLQVLQEYPNKINFEKPIAIYNHLHKYLRQTYEAEDWYILSGFAHCFLNRDIAKTATTIGGKRRFMLDTKDINTPINKQWFTDEYSVRPATSLLHNSRRFIKWARSGYTDQKQAAYNGFSDALKQIIFERTAEEYRMDRDTILLYMEKRPELGQINRF
jgi:hypothetical protein